MDDEVPDGLPRPPRRVPPGAESGVPQTVLEARQSAVRRTARGPRAWYLLPVAIAVIAAGAGVGWAVHERGDILGTGRLDLDEIRKHQGKAVVQVHASSCSGTGLATGLLVGNDNVVTPASAIRGPVSVAIETADGRVRPATVLGVDRVTGLAQLQVLGDPLGIEPLRIAAQTPSDGLDVAVIGFDGDTQTAEPHAITQPSTGADLNGVTGLLPASAAGSAVLDRTGQAIGIVSQPDPAGTRAVGASVLREFAANSRNLSVDRPRCSQAKGPQTPLVPALDGPNGSLAKEVQELLGTFLSAINRHDAQAVLDASSGGLAERSISELEDQYRYEADFNAVIHSVRQDGDGAQADMTFTTLQAVKSQIPNRCVQYAVRYFLVRTDGKLRVDGVTSARSTPQAWVPCGSD
jgi:hypothetical protein